MPKMRIGKLNFAMKNAARYHLLKSMGKGRLADKIAQELPSDSDDEGDFD